MRWFVAWRAREKEDGSTGDDDDGMERLGEWERWMLGMLG